MIKSPMYRTHLNDNRYFTRYKLELYEDAVKTRDKYMVVFSILHKG